MINLAIKTAKWIDAQVKNAGKKGVVFGLSGGIDSAVLATLVKKYCKSEIHIYWLGIESSKEDECDADLISKTIKVKLNKIDLTKEYKNLSKTISLKNKMSLINLKSRIRAITLYAIAQEKNLLVCGTSNAAELYIGYFTKFGDSACDLMPLAYFDKSEINKMARDLLIPKKIIQKKPSAGLYKGQNDEVEMGVTYVEIDSYLRKQKINEKSKKIIETKHKKNMHKLMLPLRQ